MKLIGYMYYLLGGYEEGLEEHSKKTKQLLVKMALKQKIMSMLYVKKCNRSRYHGIQALG